MQVVHAERIPSVSEQVKTALTWCRNHRRGSKYCLSQNPGRWPDLTVGILDPVLQGRRSIQGSQHPSAVLLTYEREDMAEALRKAADNGCPMRRKDRDLSLVDMLRWREQNHAAGGRGFVKLTKPGKLTIKRGRGSNDFWRVFCCVASCCVVACLHLSCLCHALVTASASV